MKIKCPKCGSDKNTYLCDEKWYGDIETECFDYDATFVCDDCEFERKIYFWGELKIDNKPFQDTL